jgi:hypothetical protein
LGVGYNEILGVYLLAIVAGVLTHAPGGAGVFEAVVVGIAPTDQQPAFTAACVVFRVLYNWLPLLFAAPLYLMFERGVRRAEANRPAPTPEALVPPPVSPAVVAGSPKRD